MPNVLTSIAAAAAASEPGPFVEAAGGPSGVPAGDAFPPIVWALPASVELEATFSAVSTLQAQHFSRQARQTWHFFL